MSEEGRRSTEVKVGLFVLFGVIAVMVAIVLLGQKRHVFQQRVKLYSVFSDVGGLVAGAPVLVSGVNVGIVSGIAFDRTGPRPLIRVELEIANSALDLIRVDSVARISSQGLLGDKLIDISAGTRDVEQITSGGLVASSPPSDIDHFVAEATQVMKKLTVVADSAATFAVELASPRNLGHISGVLESMHELLHATAHGRGLAHAIFYDHKTAREVGRIAAGVDQLVARVDHTVAALQPIFKATDRDGRQLINNLSRAAAGVGTLASEVRQSNLMPNLEHASADLVQVTGQLRHGEGTLGALVQDPTVYEQLVSILGGVGRSRVLRALVRYAISKDETAKKMQPPPPPKSTPGTQTAQPPGRRQGKR